MASDRSVEALARWACEQDAAGGALPPGFDADALRELLDALQTAVRERDAARADLEARDIFGGGAP